MFNNTISYIFLSLGLLTASAFLSPLIARKRKAAGTLNFLLVAAASINILYTCFIIIFGGSGTIETHISIANMHVPILIDGFSAVFMIIISIVACAASFYSIAYMEHYPDYKLGTYYSALPLFIAGMLLLVIVDDLFIGFTIAWQLMTLTSYALIKFEFKIKSNVTNARKYLALMELAWLLVVGGTMFISNYTFGDPLHTISKKLAMTGTAYRYAALGLVFTGFAFKAGVFPLGQLWLPDAHSIAPSPISALLSGVMLKTGIYGIARTFYWMMPETIAKTDAFTWGIIISTLGVLTLFIGTAQSLKQHDMKRLLAYSSIGQIGYIVFAVGNGLVLLNTGNRMLMALAIVSFIGAMYHIVNHAVFKGLLFLSSGSVLYATGTKDLNKLGGLIAFMPATALLAGIASLSIAGIPPASGFASKWTIISTSLLTGSGMVVILLFGIIALFTSALTLACYVKFFGMAFTSSGANWNTDKSITEVPRSMLISKVSLGLICLVQGLFPVLFYKLFLAVFKTSPGSAISRALKGTDISNILSLSPAGIKITNAAGVQVSAVSPLLILVTIIFLGIIVILFKKSGGSKEKTNAIWLCGYQQACNNNRYTDSNMFAALKKLLWWTGGNPGQKKQ